MVKANPIRENFYVCEQYHVMPGRKAPRKISVDIRDIRDISDIVSQEGFSIDKASSHAFVRSNVVSSLAEESLPEIPLAFLRDSEEVTGYTLKDPNEDLEITVRNYTHIRKAPRLYHHSLGVHVTISLGGYPSNLDSFRSIRTAIQKLYENKTQLVVVT